MGKTNDDDKDRRSRLPLTAEVGSEGGSYAEPVIQRAIRGQEVPVIDQRTDLQPSNADIAEDMPPVPQGSEDGVHFPEPAGDELPPGRRGSA